MPSPITDYRNQEEREWPSHRKKKRFLGGKKPGGHKRNDPIGAKTHFAKR